MNEQQELGEINIDASFFNKAYLPLLKNTERFTIVYGGAGSGKSHFIAQKMIVKAMSYPDRKILVVRKVAATIRESVFASFVEQLGVMGLTNLCTITSSNMKIVLPNKSMFVFTGLDDSEKIKSITNISDIVIEEATELTMDDFSQLNLRLRSKQPNQQIHLMFNPISKNNWVYQYFFKNEQPNTRILKTTYLDNKHLAQDYIDSILAYKESNPLYYQIYAMGNFGNLGKRVFDNWQVKNFDVNELVKQNLKTAIGNDLGFTNDPTTIIFSLVDLENMKLYVVEETWEKGLLNNQIAEIMFEKGYHKQVIMTDSAEPKSIAEIKSKGITKIKGVKKGAGSIKFGVQFLQQFEIIVHPDCTHLIAELEDYSYVKDKQTGYYKEEYTGDDHCIDALRYSVSHLANVKKLKSINKALFGL